MIDITGWPVFAKLIFVLSPFVIGLPGIAMSAYTTITKDYGVACSAITSNPYFENVKRAWGGGPFKWRWILICTVSGLVAFPWLALRTGKLDAGELRVFPSYLKRRLVISAWLSLISFIWMVVAWAFFKFK
ncbi:hypothetical protein [Pseudomonas sp.]|uniref:hypothetical protein n=1 Tax=Pseudomonas sp. TaxID=306 RepID=UPI003C75C197